MRNINKVLSANGLELANLPEEFQTRINNLEAQFIAYNEKCDDIEQNPGNYTAEQTDEVFQEGNGLDVLDAELSGEIKAWYKSEKDRLKKEAAENKKKEEDRLKAEQEQAEKEAADRAEAERLEKEKADREAADRAEAERIAAEQKQNDEKKGSGALGLFVGLGLTIITLGVYNAFKEK